MKKRITSLFLALALSLGLCVPALAAEGKPTFSDVPTKNWAYTYIETAYANGWIDGIGGGKFAPDADVNLAQWLTLMTRAFFGDEISKSPATGKWYDGQWYAAFAEVAEAKGLTLGMGLGVTTAEKKADYNKSITREEMAHIMGGVLSKYDIQATDAQYATIDSKIPDIDQVSEKYQGQVRRVYALGLLTGVDGYGTFAPKANMSRAQAAVVLCRMAEAIGGEAGTLPEVPGTPETPRQPETPEVPETGKHGAVGTLSDSPVTLSYATHAPKTDYWSDAPADVRSVTDKDAFNAAVQSIRDQNMIRDPDVLKSAINPYYNYAAYIRTGSTEQVNVTSAVSNLGGQGTGFAAKNRVPGADRTDLAVITATYTASVHNVIDPILANMPNGSDKAKAEYMVQAICDIFSYLVGPNFSWTSSGREGDCNSYANVVSAIFTAAGIPQFQVVPVDTTSGVPHACNMAYLDGNWYVVDAAFADTAADISFAHMTETDYCNFYNSNPLTTSINAKICMALINAAYN